MPPRKPQSKASANPKSKGHVTEVEAYSSKVMNTTLYQPLCSCGWQEPRYPTQARAQIRCNWHLMNVGATK